MVEPLPQQFKLRRRGLLPQGVFQCGGGLLQRVGAESGGAAFDGMGQALRLLVVALCQRLVQRLGIAIVGDAEACTSLRYSAGL